MKGSLRPEFLAIIPARGGSKGLARKNIRTLCGKPLIAYTIEASLGANFINRTIVTTDDPEIAAIAEEYGAEVIARPSELATDEALVQPVMEHVVTTVEADGYKPDILVLLNPTSPLRMSIDIDKAAHGFMHGFADTLVSVYPGQVCVWEKRDGQYKANYDISHKIRRQDMPMQFLENGAIYMVKRDYLMEHHEFLGGRMVITKMPEVRSVDINTALDFVIAEAILNADSSRKPEV